MNVSWNSSVSDNVHVDVLFEYALIIVVLLLYIEETKIINKILAYLKHQSTPNGNQYRNGNQYQNGNQYRNGIHY